MDREELNRMFGLTEEQLNAMAAEYEEETWEGGLTDVVHGRPKLYDEDMETVSFRLPKSRRAAVEAVTRRLGISKSEFFRNAIDHELVACSA